MPEVQLLVGEFEVGSRVGGEGGAADASSCCCSWWLPGCWLRFVNVRAVPVSALSSTLLLLVLALAMVAKATSEMSKALAESGVGEARPGPVGLDSLPISTTAGSSKGSRVEGAGGI